MERKNRDKKVCLLGVYDYTVWLTYFGLFISIVGIMEGLHGKREAWEEDKGIILFGSFRTV